MELILNEEDLKAVLKEHYEGVEDIKFEKTEKTIKSILSIKSDFLRRKSYSIVSSSSNVGPNTTRPSLEILKNDGQKEVPMASGGKERIMSHVQG